MAEASGRGRDVGGRMRDRRDLHPDGGREGVPESSRELPVESLMASLRHDGPPAGPELDRLIHEVIFGPVQADEEVPSYSAIWEDAQKLKDRCRVFAVQRGDGDQYSAVVTVVNGPRPRIAHALGPTPALAAARAVLASLIAAEAEEADG